MKRVFVFLLAATMVLTLNCGSDDPVETDCAMPIGSELLTYSYSNPSTPSVSTPPVSSTRSISFGEAEAELVGNEVTITIPGIRVSTEANNFEITRIKVDEMSQVDDCFVKQAEFDLIDSNFQTAVSSVLVLDMSTSVTDIVNDLKSYAKEYASTIVNSSANSQVAVVFFSSRNAIAVTDFYNSGNIQTLNGLIDDFTNYQERTALYQATKAGLDLLASDNFEGEESLVVFTDGSDNDSNNPTVLIEEINSADVSLFAIGLRGDDFRDSNLASIISNNSNFLVANTEADLQQVFRTVGKGVVSVYEVTYTRSDQLLNNDEAIEIRFSFETTAIER